jgi:protein-S-isoprenylcysteine O-methyltransferase Ste14
MHKRLLARFAVRETMGVLFMALALFWPAGGVQWWQAWALLALTSAWIIATAIVIWRHNPDLFAERLGPRKGAKRWDTTLGAIRGILQLVLLVVAGFDHRYGWSTTISTAAEVFALAISTLGYSLVVWATASNAFFSSIVRIQSERGHTVVTGGPYQYVRHPAYAGGILTALSTPILLGSWWAFLLGLIDAFLVVLRTSLEDRTLSAELPGYPEYSLRVRRRLLPGIW